MQHYAELVSLFLTIPTITLAIIVLYLWVPKANHSLIKRHKESSDWFILGVTIGFTGQVLDNLYWMIPWSMSYVGCENTADYINYGVYFNIPSRQICGILSAYCHVKSYLSYIDTENRSKIRVVEISSFIFGAMYTAILIFCKFKKGE